MNYSMNKTKVLSMAVLILCGWVSAYGQDDFNPSTPPEPGAPIVKHQLTLLAEPANGGSVSGGGRYDTGKSINVRASVNSYFSFAGWTNTKGEVVSSTASFSYTLPDRNDTLIAHFDFTPSTPNEPQPAQEIQYFTLKVDASIGGSASGGGKYQGGKSVYLSSSGETGYAFLNWTNSKGEVVSSSRSFYYTTQQYNETLTANYVFDPSTPSEPSEPVIRHHVYVDCSDGGYFSGNSHYYILTGNTVTLYAYTNTGYVFKGWYLNDEFYTALRSFSYKVGEENVRFHAEFEFDPTAPSEPNMPAINQYSYYLMTVNDIPGTTIKYPIYLANTQNVKDMTLQLTFPKDLQPDLDSWKLADNATGYTVTLAEMEYMEDYIYEEGDRVYCFTLIGGTTTPATAPLLTFDITIPEDMKTGGRHQVRINQISMTQDDGTSVTARTRNGKIGVFEVGDASMDGSVDIVDSRLVINDFLETGTDELEMRISDIVEDGSIDVQDSRAIINKYLNTVSEPAEQEENEVKQTTVL